MYICSLSSSLELPGKWSRVRRSPLHWHMSDPRRIILSDQHPWTFTCSTISYGAPPWFLLLRRIVNKMWDLSPMQRPKFLLPHNNFQWVYQKNIYNFQWKSSLLSKKGMEGTLFLLYQHVLHTLLAVWCYCQCKMFVSCSKGHKNWLFRIFYITNILRFKKKKKCEAPHSI